MNHSHRNLKSLALAALATAALQASLHAQGTAFTYQGRLDSSGTPATGLYDLQFNLYGVASGGSALTGVVSLNAQPVTNGLFTVTLDFGNQFPGAPRWVELGVRTNGGGPFTTLAPRQSLAATPYAITAGNLTGPLPSASLAGSYSGAVTLNNAANNFTGNGAGLTGLNASNLASGTVPDARLGTNVARMTQVWQLGGNAGTTPATSFLGTTDNQPVELKANNRRALRLEPTSDAANLIGGSAANAVSNGVVGAVIAGGGDNAGFPNRVGGSHSAIGGGLGNAAVGVQAVIGGGSRNSATAVRAVVGGGFLNVSGGGGSVVGGGNQNSATGNFSTIGGGADNVASGQGAAIPGGINNTANATLAAAMGYRAKANHNGAFVWADSQEADFSSSAANQFLIRASGGVAIGTNDPAGAALRVAGAIRADSFLGSGTTLTLGTTDNQPVEFMVNGQRALRLEYSTDGFGNIISPNLVGGFVGNVVDNGVLGGVIGGGGNVFFPNRVGANYATVVGGGGNTASGPGSTAMGAQVTASGAGSTAMGDRTTASGYGSTAMGVQATASGDNSTAMGILTTASGSASTAMGLQTTASGFASTAMGSGTSATNNYSTAMGRVTLAGGFASTAMGLQTTASGFASTAMGSETSATNNDSTAMGRLTMAGGSASTAMGYRAKAIHHGSLVWADQQEADFASTADNEFSIRASGGVRLNNDTRLHFGAQTRQMLNLWNAEYGIGVQSDTTYFRSGNDFAWYRGGAHDDNQGNPGSGGTALMYLNRFGQLGLGTTAPQFQLDAVAPQSVARLTTTGSVFGAVLVMKNTAASPAYLGAINFENSSGITVGQIGYLAEDTLIFTTGAAQRMRLNASGLTVNGTFVSASDRNVKEDFAAVDAQEVLEKVAALPLQSWSYTNRPGVKHVGPMAQDFRAAFGLGEDDKHIATIDADGVALAAIQGLNQKVESENSTLRAENAELKARLERIERLLEQPSAHR